MLQLRAVHFEVYRLDFVHVLLARWAIHFARETEVSGFQPPLFLAAMTMTNHFPGPWTPIVS